MKWLDVPEKDGYKRMERESKGPRDLEAYCSGGQVPPRAVAPTDDDDRACLKYSVPTFVE